MIASCRPLLAVFALLGALSGSTPALAGFVRAAVAPNPTALTEALNDLAHDSFRFEVAVDGLPHFTVLSSCDESTCHEDGRYSYRVLAGPAGELARAAADGFRFRAVVPSGDRGVFLFERDGKAAAGPIEMRWLELALPVGSLDAVAAARGEGFRVEGAATGRGVVTLLLSRHPGDSGTPHEVLRLSDHPAPLGAAISRAAAEGFALDAMWSRRPGGSPFAVELNALLSRPRGGAPAQGSFEGMTERSKVGQQGRLVGSLEWNERRAFFFRREAGWELDVEERDLPAEATSSPKRLRESLDEAFRSSPFDPMVSAWAERQGDGTWRIVTLSIDEEPR